MNRALLLVAAASLVACGGSSSPDTSCQGAQVQLTPPSSAKVNQEVDIQVKFTVDKSCLPDGGDLDVSADITGPTADAVSSSSTNSTSIDTDPSTLEGTIGFTGTVAGTYHVAGTIGGGLRTFSTDVNVTQ